MRITFAAAVVWGGALATLVWAQSSESKVDLQSLPPAVQEAVKAQSEGATLRGVTEEVTGGTTVYEVELTVGGRTRDLTLDAEGRVVSLEEQTTLEGIPAPAREAILKAVGTGKLTLVEKVTKGEKTFYEGHIAKGDQELEVKVDASGKLVE